MILFKKSVLFPNRLRRKAPRSRPSGPKQAAALVLALALTTPAFAQDRTPTQRQTLVQLAYVLGQSHALRQACMGPDDQYWRERMTRLVQTESPDSAFDVRLRDSFNSGFSSSQAQFPSCGSDSRTEEARTASRGRALAASLAREMAGDQPVR
jgi:uncharacterized protein (TIGR02301 family)